MLDRLRAAVILAAVVPLAGCFQSSSVLQIKADGSGTITQRTLLTEAALDQLRAFTILGGGRGGDVDPLSEAQARTLASAIGPGVTYVSSMPIATGGAKGREAVYAFTDISTVRISEQPQIPGGVSVRAPGINTDMPPITFALDRQPDGHATLRIVVPRPTIPGTTPTGGGTFAPPSTQQIDMAKQLLAGARLTVIVEPEGQLIRTSSPYVEGNRVVLIELDIDQATRDPAVVQRFVAATTVDEAKAAIAGVPGVKLNLDPEITIEFAPPAAR